MPSPKQKPKRVKKKLTGLAGWGDVLCKLEIGKCPKCDYYVRDLNPLGFFMGVCDRCKKFWSLKVVDVTKGLAPSFKKENLPKSKVSLYQNKTKR